MRKMLIKMSAKCQPLHSGLSMLTYCPLTHWGRVTHICVGNLTIIGPDNGLSPGRRQAIIWTNAGILLIGPWGTNFSEILNGIQTFSFKKMHFENVVCEMTSILSRPQCVQRCWSDFTSVFFKLILWSDILSTSYKIGLRWVPQKLIDKPVSLGWPGYSPKL